jgi:hypothetical protein
MNMTTRSLTYTLNVRQFRSIIESDHLNNLIAVGKLLNAITYAQHNGVLHQLANFAIDDESIFITGGLLYEAFLLSEKMINKYKDHPYVNEFQNLLESISEFNPPEVLLDMRSNGPFRIHSKNIVINAYLKMMNLSGKNDLLPKLGAGQSRRFSIATIANSDEVMDELKSGIELEVHRDMASVVECLVDEFTLAAEEFIFWLTRKLNMKPVS